MSIALSLSVQRGRCLTNHSVSVSVHIFLPAKHRRHLITIHAAVSVLTNLYVLGNSVSIQKVVSVSVPTHQRNARIHKSSMTVVAHASAQNSNA